MKKGITITNIIITAIFMVLAFTTVNAYAEDYQTGALLEVSADKDEVFRTQNVNLVLSGSNLNDLYTMRMEVRYDPKILGLDQAAIKNLIWEFNQNGYDKVEADLKTGVVNIIYSRKGKVQGVSGNFDLIRLPFKALRIGRTTVEVNNIKLVNSQGNMIKTTTSSITKEINVVPNPLGIKFTGVKGKNDWYISTVTVEVTDTDASEIFYTIDGTQYHYTQPFSIQAIGQHSLTITANDGYGYIKEKEEIVKIDYNPPTLTVDNQSPDWQNTELKVIPKYNDGNGSGILQTWYQWTNATGQPAVWDEYNQGELIQTTEGIWYLHTKAIDAAGNESEAVFGPYKIDKTVPAISADNVKREAWGSTDVSVTPAFTDEGGSQLKYVGHQWSLDQSVPSEYTPYTSGSILQSNEGAWYLHLIAEDWAGNVKTVTYGPYNIDKTAPIIECSGITEGVDYTDTVTPIIPIYDTVSGIKAGTLQLDGQDYVSGTPITERGTHTITAFAEDYAGNIATKSISFIIHESTTLTLDIPQVEYSDLYTINATLTAGSQAVSGAAISVKLNGTDMGTFYSDSQGNITLNGITSFTAGTYTVDAIYQPDDSEYYSASQSHSSLTVLTEKNSLVYTGSYEVLYPGIFTVSALMSQENDSNPGDLSLARFSVEIMKYNMDGSTTLQESFITNCETNGVISFERNYEMGVYTVYIKLLDDGYYTPGTAYITIPVYQDGKSDVSCGGWLLLPDPSTGELVKVTCNFNVKYKTVGADGRFKLFFEEAGININDGNIEWLVLEGNTAQFQGTDGTYTYRVSCIDNSNNDYITLRIWSGTDTSATPILEIINLEQDGGSINVKDTTGGNDNGKADENGKSDDNKKADDNGKADENKKR